MNIKKLLQKINLKFVLFLEPIKQINCLAMVDKTVTNSRIES